MVTNKIQLNQKTGLFIGTVIGIDGVVVQGRTHKEVQSKIKSAIQAILHARNQSN